MDDRENAAMVVGGLVVHAAGPGDVQTMHRFIVELAETEEFPGEVSAQPSDLAEALFGSRPVAEAVVAVVDGQSVGFALYYPTYSTVLGRQGMHLEDLYVSDGYRGHGVGQELLSHLAQLAVRRGCARLEWWVLRTNEPALRFWSDLAGRPVSLCRR